MPEHTLSKYVVIAGHGRSGTNLVLDLFDFHRNTFCRNEPNEVLGSAFTGLGDGMFTHNTPDDFDDQWRRAVTATKRSSGARDRFRIQKDYFRSAVYARFGQALMSRQKIRGLLLPRIDGHVTQEWPCPKFYFNALAKEQALPVLKILLCPAWVTQAHDSNRAQLVVHVQRRPQSFVQSWWTRYVIENSSGPEHVFTDNQPSLAHILEHFDRTAEMPTEYSLSNLVVSELWRWRYMNEMLIQQLSDSPRYKWIGYETLMTDKINATRAIFDFAGLELTQDCRQSIETMQNTLFKARKSNRIDPELVNDAVNLVLEGSAHRDQLLNG